MNGNPTRCCLSEGLLLLLLVTCFFWFLKQDSLHWNILPCPPFISAEKDWACWGPFCPDSLSPGALGMALRLTEGSSFSGVSFREAGRPPPWDGASTHHEELMSSGLRAYVLESYHLSLTAGFIQV